MRSLATLLLFATPVLAQSERLLSAGAIAGADFRQTLATTHGPQPLDCGVACLVEYSTPARKPLLFGAAVEARVSHHVAIEADALYQRLGFSSVFEMASPSSGLLFSFSKTTASRWEVPIVGKYRFGHVFALAGGAIDGVAAVHSEADIGSRSFLGHVGVQHTAFDDSGQMTKGPRAGVVAGGGVELRAGRFRVAPQLRVTRRLRRFVAEPDVRTNSWEVGAFVSFMF
jgi:hypothetical protein